MSVAGRLAEQAPMGETPRAKVRRLQILAASSRLFGRWTFEATSMRDIATAAKITPASLYYHFASKEALYIAVQAKGIQKICEAVSAAIARHKDPWARLEAAAIAHCKSVLDDEGFPVLLTPILPCTIDPETRAALVQQRDRLDRIYGELIAALPLAAGIDRRIFRLHFLSALNGTALWYRASAGLSSREIALQLVAMIRGQNDCERDEPVAKTSRLGEETVLWERLD